MVQTGKWSGFSGARHLSGLVIVGQGGEKEKTGCRSRARVTGLNQL